MFDIKNDRLKRKTPDQNVQPVELSLGLFRISVLAEYSGYCAMD